MLKCIFLFVFLVGCKSRDIETSNVNDADTVKSDPTGSLTAPVPIDYLADGGSVGSSLKTPYDYQKTFPNLNRNDLPQRLATKSVLEVMRRNRLSFNESVPGDPNHQPEGASGLRPDKQYLYSKGYMNIRQSADVYAESPQDPNVKSRCIAYGTPHYSDIQNHYYCQIPALWRGCHRMLLFAFQTSPSSINAKAAESRSWAINTCLIPTTDDQKFADEFAKMFTLSPSQLPGAFSFNAFEESRDLREYFQAMYNNQFVVASDGTRVNIFDYIMRSQTYAYDWNDQNEVINQFYGDMVPASDKWDPADIQMCHTWRPARSEDDSTANYCLVTTPKVSPLMGIGR
jgi:hypothetical protein